MLFVNNVSCASRFIRTPSLNVRVSEKYSKSIYSKTKPQMKKFYSLLSLFHLYYRRRDIYIYIYLHTYLHTRAHNSRAHVYVRVLFSVLSYNYNSIADIYANSYFENIMKYVESYLHVKYHRKHSTLDTLLYPSVFCAFRTIFYKYVNIRSQFNISRT